MMKRLAVAVCAVVVLASSSSYAYWDYFKVIDAGSAEAELSTDNGIKIRFGVMDNLEIMATMGSPLGMTGNYSVGARYQIIPEMLSASLDFGFPTNRYQNIGIGPAVQFHMGLTEMIEFGLGAGLGIDINNWINNPASLVDGVDPETEMAMHLHFGLELGFTLTDNFGAWVGADFEMNNLHADEADDMVITPLVGITYTVDNITVGTNIGIDLVRNSNRNGDAESIGLTGAVDFSIRF